MARNLGQSATEAGVERTVVLSIIGVDQMTDFGYYAAKLAHERATLAYAPDVHILRATQFMNLPGQMLTWSRNGNSVTVPEMPTQPVTVDDIARVLVDLADSRDPRDRVELAGPNREELADLIRQLIARRGEDVTVETVVASEAMAAGACLPGPDADITGPDFVTWLHDTEL